VVSIVIPSYDHWELTNQILTDLYNHCLKDIDEVIVVNNGSTDPNVAEGMKHWFNSAMPVKEFVIPKNIGFLRASNKGIEFAKGEIVVLISNDVRIESDNLILEIKRLLKNKCLVSGKLYNDSTGWNDFGGTIYKYGEGWLLAFTKETWKDLGGFDDRYAPNDYEDVDISTTALSKGYTLVALDNVSLTHLGGKTLQYSPNRQALTETNREKFRDKWIKKNG